MCLPGEHSMILLDVEGGCLVGSSQGLPFFKMGLMFSFFQSALLLKTSWIWLRIAWPFSTSAYSFRTLGCISLVPMDWCMFKYLRWSWTWAFLTVNCSLQSQPCGSGNWEMWEERFILKALVKNCWIAQPSPYQFSLVLMSYLSRAGMFTLIFLFLASIPVEVCISLIL